MRLDNLEIELGFEGQYMFNNLYSSFNCQVAFRLLSDVCQPVDSLFKQASKTDALYGQICNTLCRYAAMPSSIHCLNVAIFSFGQAPSQGMEP